MIEFPKTYSVLLQGLPGVGKSEYCMQLIKDYLKNGEKVVFVSTEKSPADIRKRMKEIGLDLKPYEGESFLFIDIFTRSAGTREEKVLYVDNPSNLNLVSVRLSEASEALGGPIRIIFDSLSTFFLHAPEEEIRSFFESINAKIKADKSFVLFTLHEEMHDEKAVVTLKAMVLSALEMSIEDAPNRKRMVRVDFAKEGVPHSSDWYEFQITGDGLEVLGIIDTSLKEKKAQKEDKRNQFLIKIATVAIVLLLAGMAIFQIIGNIPPPYEDEMEYYRDNQQVTAAPSAVTGAPTAAPSATMTPAQIPQPTEIPISEFRLDGMEDAGNWYPMEGSGAYLDISESTEFSKVDKSMKVSVEILGEEDSYAAVSLFNPDIVGYDGVTVWSHVPEPTPLGRLEMSFEEEGGARYSYMRMRNLNKAGWIKDIVPFKDVRESPWSDHKDDNGQLDLDQVKLISISVGGGPGGELGTYVFYLDELNLFRYETAPE